MVRRTGGMRRKTRHKLRKSVRQRGKISFARYFQQFKEGDKVVLKAEPAIQTGMYDPRMHGKIGTVTGQQGTCYSVKIYDGDKAKQQIVHPVHLKRV